MEKLELESSLLASSLSKVGNSSSFNKVKASFLVMTEQYVDGNTPIGLPTTFNNLPTYQPCGSATRTWIISPFRSSKSPSAAGDHAKSAIMKILDALTRSWVETEVVASLVVVESSVVEDDALESCCPMTLESDPCLTVVSSDVATACKFAPLLLERLGLPMVSCFVRVEEEGEPAASVPATLGLLSEDSLEP